MTSKKTNKNAMIQAITNAKCLSSETNKILNIAIKNHKIIALGYLPDDDDINEINVCHHLIINNIFNLGSFVTKESSPTEPNTQLKNTPNLTIIDSYNLIKHIASHTLNASPTCYISMVTLSEFLFITQETKKTLLPTHCHLILQYIDNDTQTMLSSLKLPKNLSLGVYLPEKPSPHIPHIESLLLSKTISSVSCKPTIALSTLIMTYFPKTYPKIIDLLFNQASTTLFNVPPIPLEIGNKINTTFIHKNPPHTIALIISNGSIKIIKGKSHEAS